MALAITTEHEQLGETVGRFLIRHARIDKTRAAFDWIAAGELPSGGRSRPTDLAVATMVVDRTAIGN